MQGYIRLLCSDILGRKIYVITDQVCPSLHDRDIDPYWSSWIGSIQMFLGLGMGLVSGRAFDTGYL